MFNKSSNKQNLRVDKITRLRMKIYSSMYKVKLWLHQCDFEILTHGINFFGDNLFLLKLTLVETKFFTEQILTEYPCSTSENLKLLSQNSALISEKFALVDTSSSSFFIARFSVRVAGAAAQD